MGAASLNVVQKQEAEVSALEASAWGAETDGRIFYCLLFNG
jgi:hypothetical protein